jgi:hypothetical protein
VVVGQLDIDSTRNKARILFGLVNFSLELHLLSHVKLIKRSPYRFREDNRNLNQIELEGITVIFESQVQSDTVILEAIANFH